jgi:hypothetical protein
MLYVHEAEYVRDLRVPLGNRREGLRLDRVS